MTENFPTGYFLRKADKCFGVCIVNWSMDVGHGRKYNVSRLKSESNLLDDNAAEDLLKCRHVDGRIAWAHRNRGVVYSVYKHSYSVLYTTSPNINRLLTL